MAKRRRRKRPLFVGIDPGQQGFVCVVDLKGNIVAMWDLPLDGKRLDRRRLRKMLRALKLAGACQLIVEAQQPFQREGAVGAFTNGYNYASLVSCVEESGIYHEIHRAQDWKRAMKIPVPDVPKPNLPPKPARKGAPMRKWKKECRKLNEKRSREVSKLRKQFACEAAQELQPDFDFRLSARARTPHDGKCEAFLIARLALEQATRSKYVHYQAA